MKTENRVFDNGSERQHVKEVRVVLPYVGVSVLTDTLVVEAVDLRDLTALVVSAQDRDAVAVAHLEADEQCDRFERVVASVDVITHEEVVRVGRVSANAEQLHQVVELTVNVAAHSNRAANGLDIALRLQNFFRFLANDAHFTLWKGFAIK